MAGDLATGEGSYQGCLRTLERHVDLRGGERATSKLLIGFTELGTLTTEDQKMFYALIHQWENAGKPTGRPVYFSDRLLSRMLKKKGWGTNVIQAITGSLRRLRTTPLRWIRSFHKNGDASQEYEEEIPFQLLDDLKIVTRRSHGHVTNQQGSSSSTGTLRPTSKPTTPSRFWKTCSSGWRARLPNSSIPTSIW